MKLIFFIGVPGAKVPMSFPKKNPVDGWVHTHYEGTGYIFSLHDIWLMVYIYEQGGMANPSTFSSAVVTPQNTYMLRIENISLFKAFAEKYKNEEGQLIEEFK